MSEADLEFLPVLTSDGKNQRLAARRVAAVGEGVGRPGVVWIGGFMSDMTSTKAAALAQWGQRTGRAVLRFDYSGHGLSDGAFTDGTVGRWLADTLAAIRALSQGPQIMVGSSMGAWIALLAIRALADAGEAERIAGSVLIAPAVDFTERLMWERFSPSIRETVMTEGVWERPSPYGAPYPITRALIEDGRHHLLLDGRIEAHGPVHILQGMMDEDVPWSHAMTLVEHFAADPVSITLVREGDHRLSDPADIARLIAAVEGIA